MHRCCRGPLRAVVAQVAPSTTPEQCVLVVASSVPSGDRSSSSNYIPSPSPCPVSLTRFFIVFVVVVVVSIIVLETSSNYVPRIEKKEGKEEREKKKGGGGGK